VVVLCDLDPAVVQEVGDRFGIAGRSRSAAALAGRDDLDAVFVAISVLAAPSVISLFLEAGIPTFLEKPPGLYSASTAQLVELGERRGTVAMVGLNRRFYSTHTAVRERLAAHGPLRTISVQAHEDLADQPSKHGPEMSRRLLYHNSVHVLDLLRYFVRDGTTAHYTFDVRTREPYWAAAMNYPAREWLLGDVYPEGEDPVAFSLVRGAQGVLGVPTRLPDRCLVSHS
jgi:predicted dehydrogenase